MAGRKAFRTVLKETIQQLGEVVGPIVKRIGGHAEDPPSMTLPTISIILLAATMILVVVVVLWFAWFVSPLATAIILGLLVFGLFGGLMAHAWVSSWDTTAGFPRTFVRTVERAERGDHEAMRELASIYRRGGDGILADPSQSVWWLTRAAEAGSSEAATELAQMIERGEGVRRDAAQARAWGRFAGDLRDQTTTPMVEVTGAEMLDVLNPRD